MTYDNEQTMIAQAQNGDRKALEALVNAFAPVVYKFSYNICRNQDKAENTTQETFLSVLKNLKQFDNRSKFTTWLYTIVSNHCLMAARSRKSDRYVSLDDDEGPLHDDVFVETDETPHERLERIDMKAHLDEAIEQLAPDYRIVFMLRDVEGLSTEEVSGITNLSIAAVKSRLHRARKFLRNYLSPFMEEKAYVAS